MFMTKNFLNFIITTLGMLLAFAIRAIFGVEIEEFWNLKAQPLLEENSWGWVVKMLDFISTFWGGVLLTILLLLIVDRVLSKFNLPERMIFNKDKKQESLKTSLNIYPDTARVIIKRVTGKPSSHAITHIEGGLAHHSLTEFGSVIKDPNGEEKFKISYSSLIVVEENEANYDFVNVVTFADDVILVSSQKLTQTVWCLVFQNIDIPMISVEFSKADAVPKSGFRPQKLTQDTEEETLL